MDTQQKRMLAVSAAAATLGLAAAALGIAAEYFTHKALRSSRAWLLAVAAAAMFLYGASWNAGRGRRGSFTAIYRLPGRFFYRCPELRNGFFVSASINAGLGITCAIAAYADLHRRKRNYQTVTLGGVAMGQPSYPPAPVAYPAQPLPYGAYGAKQPAGTV